MASIDKVKRYYIYNHTHLSIEQLCKDTNLSEATIKRALKARKQLDKDKERYEEKKSVREGLKTSTTAIDSKMVKKTGNGRKGIVAMTPAASEIGDATRQNRLGTKLSDAITQIRAE